MKSPELLLPAGSLQHMRYAFAYGADAVYAGPPRYSLRARNNEFDLSNMAIGIKEAHQRGKLFFATINLMPHNSKLKTFLRDIGEIISMKPDALIMADAGLIMLVRENYPDIPIHLSVQANAVNWAAVKFWNQMGIQRVILSRELSFEEIAEIRQMCPDVELEVFVHGALCIAYSGRCLLSGYFNHRDPNQGTCTNSCRWNYKVHEDEGEAGVDTDPMNKVAEIPNVTEIKSQKPYLLEEANRPNEYMPIEEDDNGTYIMNSKDLRAIQHIPKLVEMGIDCVKIEGRTKSCYYVARTAQTYRQAIDDACAGRDFNPQLIGTLENLANRGYTDGFFQRHQSQEYQNYIDSHSKNRVQRVCAEILEFEEQTRCAKILSKNKIKIGDEVEVINPKGNYHHVIDVLQDHKGHPIEEIKGGGVNAQLILPRAEAGLSMLATNLSP
jgi:putative protease